MSTSRSVDPAWATPPTADTDGTVGQASPDDLSAWVLATAPRAVAYATSLLGDRERAEDVVQDCYCRLLDRAKFYDLPRDGLKLLFRSVSNACINAKSRRRFVLSLSINPSRDEDRPIEVVDRSAVDPVEQMMEKELATAIGRGLDRLPVTQRAALELRSLGHSQQEIAEILQTSANAAGVLVHRARKAMEAYLAPFLGRPTP